MIKRNITSSVLDALKHTPVVFINGARQVGKSTLLEYIVKNIYPAEYYTFDDPNTRSNVSLDPLGFISNIKKAAIDEVQSVKNIFQIIKFEVDKNRQPGRFLCSGSSNIFLLPKMAEYLVGRMEIISLYPFSQGELEELKEDFIDYVFSSKEILFSNFVQTKKQILKRAVFGGYPEIVTVKQKTRLENWFSPYINTIVQREIRNISSIEKINLIPRLISLLAARSTSLINVEEISNNINIPQTTLRRYISLLQASFLINFLPAYSGNYSKRLIKAPKLYFIDTGLMAYLLGLTGEFNEKSENLYGKLIENFVIMEIQKQISWSKIKPQMFYFRDVSGNEIDIILENRQREIVAIEVKLTSTLTGREFKNLKNVSKYFEKNFKRGIILYTGQNVLPFGKNLYAMPIESLWKLGAKKN